MGAIAEAVRRMLGAGVDAETIVLAVEGMEAMLAADIEAVEDGTSARERRRERNARYYEKRRACRLNSDGVKTPVRRLSDGERLNSDVLRRFKTLSDGDEPSPSSPSPEEKRKVSPTPPLKKKLNPLPLHPHPGPPISSLRSDIGPHDFQLTMPMGDVRNGEILQPLPDTFAPVKGRKPVDILAMVVDRDRAQAQVEARARMKRPLTNRAAWLLARSLQQIERGGGNAGGRDVATAFHRRH